MWTKKQAPSVVPPDEQDVKVSVCTVSAAMHHWHTAMLSTNYASLLFFFFFFSYLHGELSTFTDVGRSVIVHNSLNTKQYMCVFLPKPVMMVYIINHCMLSTIWKRGVKSLMHLFFSSQFTSKMFINLCLNLHSFYEKYLRINECERLIYTNHY